MPLQVAPSRAGACIDVESLLVVIIFKRNASLMMELNIWRDILGPARDKQAVTSCIGPFLGPGRPLALKV